MTHDASKPATKAAAEAIDSATALYDQYLTLSGIGELSRTSKDFAMPAAGAPVGLVIWPS